MFQMLPRDCLFFSPPSAPKVFSPPAIPHLFFLFATSSMSHYAFILHISFLRVRLTLKNVCPASKRHWWPLRQACVRRGLRRPGKAMDLRGNTGLSIVISPIMLDTKLQDVPRGLDVCLISFNLEVKRMKYYTSENATTRWNRLHLIRHITASWVHRDGGLWKDLFH